MVLKFNLPKRYLPNRTLGTKIYSHHLVALNTINGGPTHPSCKHSGLQVYMVLKSNMPKNDPLYPQSII